jgi:peptidoglycan hydrolase-like protein with peptidoglycan-binding domain
MAYSDEDKRQQIREVQEYLYAISFYDDNIIRVIPDGIYGRETALSVRSFQTEHDLPVTGEVDRQTWDKIVEVYREYVALPPYPIDVFPSTMFVLDQNRSGSLVYILQAMLLDIYKTYKNVPQVNVNGTYDDITVETIKRIQEIANLNVTGLTNRTTWNVIVTTYNHLDNDYKY